MARRGCERWPFRTTSMRWWGPTPTARARPPPRSGSAALLKVSRSRTGPLQGPAKQRSAHMPQRILVTGGAGYLGSIVCEHLLGAGHHVTVVDNLMYGQEPLFHLCAHPSFDFVRGDARDERVMHEQ